MELFFSVPIESFLRGGHRVNKTSDTGAATPESVDSDWPSPRNYTHVLRENFGQITGQSRPQ